MTSDNELQYHYYFEPIAEEDARTLRKKDAEYGGSWKNRGGVNAYCMLVRKFDRIENAMNLGTDPDTGEQVFRSIFKAIKEDDRPDGLLDDIRDLRRYLILLEAYAMQQGWAKEVQNTSLADASFRNEIKQNMEKKFGGKTGVQDNAHRPGPTKAAEQAHELNKRLNPKGDADTQGSEEQVEAGVTHKEEAKEMGRQAVAQAFHAPEEPTAHGYVDQDGGGTITVNDAASLLHFYDVRDALAYTPLVTPGRFLLDIATLFPQCSQVTGMPDSNTEGTSGAYYLVANKQKVRENIYIVTYVKNAHAILVGVDGGARDCDISFMGLFTYNSVEAVLQALDVPEFKEDAIQQARQLGGISSKDLDNSTTPKTWHR